MKAATKSHRQVYAIFFTKKAKEGIDKDKSVCYTFIRKNMQKGGEDHDLQSAATKRPSALLYFPRQKPKGNLKDQQIRVFEGRDLRVPLFLSRCTAGTIKGQIK